MVEKVGYKHEEQGHLERRESPGWITGAHTGCFSPKSGTEPQSPKSLLLYCRENMSDPSGECSCVCHNSPPLQSITFGRELDCRLRGLMQLLVPVSALIQAQMLEDPF